MPCANRIRRVQLHCRNAPRATASSTPVLVLRLDDVRHYCGRLRGVQTDSPNAGELAKRTLRHVPPTGQRPRRCPSSLPAEGNWQDVDAASIASDPQASIGPLGRFVSTEQIARGPTATG